MSWRIGEILIQKKWLSWDQLRDALEEQTKTRELIGQILIRKRYVPEFLFYKALAEQYSMRFVDLSRTRMNPVAVERIPKSIAAKFDLMPIEYQKNTLTIGVSNPLQSPPYELRELAGVADIQRVICTPSDISKAIEENYSSGEE